MEPLTDEEYSDLRAFTIAHSPNVVGIVEKGYTHIATKPAGDEPWDMAEIYLSRADYARLCARAAAAGDDAFDNVVWII